MSSLLRKYLPFIALGVGGVVLFVLISWGVYLFGEYRDLKKINDQFDAQRDRLEKQTEQIDLLLKYNHHISLFVDSIKVEVAQRDGKISSLKAQTTQLQKSLQSAQTLADSFNNVVAQNGLLQQQVYELDLNYHAEKLRADTTDKARHQALAQLAQVRDTLKEVRRVNEDIRKLCTKRSPIVELVVVGGVGAQPLKDWTPRPTIAVGVSLAKLRL